MGKCKLSNALRSLLHHNYTAEGSIDTYTVLYVHMAESLD